MRSLQRGFPPEVFLEVNSELLTAAIGQWQNRHDLGAKLQTEKLHLIHYKACARNQSNDVHDAH